MKNKAFTLIELLAVIVVLGIIALIATPIVLNIIKDAKISSQKRSIENYAKAIENSIASYQLNRDKLPSGLYQTTDGKTLIQGTTKFNVDYSGSNIVCNKINIYNDGEVYLSLCKIDYKSIDYTYGPEYYANGTPVYFDVSTGKKCSEEKYKESFEDNDYSNSKTNYNGISATKTSDKQNSCLKFYAYNDFDSNKISLLLDHNLFSDYSVYGVNISSQYLSYYNYILDKLNNVTSSWLGTEIPTNYVIDRSYLNYTVNYNNLKARYITAEEINLITGNKLNFLLSDTINYTNYFFDTNSDITSETCTYGSTSGCKYGWLYDRVNSYCKEYGCQNNSIDTNGSSNGYITTTPSLDSMATPLWTVTPSSSLFPSDSSLVGEIDVRPVIEVLKSKLK